MAPAGPSVPNHLVRDEEERRLLAESEDCHAKAEALADSLSNPRHSMLHPAYVAIANRLAALRSICREKVLAVREYRKKMRDEGGPRS